MNEEKIRERVITKADVAAAKATVVGLNQHPTTQRVRAELKESKGHSGNQNQVATWLKELRDEEKAAAGEVVLPMPVDSRIIEILNGGAAAINSTVESLAVKLIAVLSIIKGEDHRSVEASIDTVRAEADERVKEAETEARDADTEIERLDKEIEALQQAVENKAAELAVAKELLAAEQGRAMQLQAERDTTKDEIADARMKTEEAKAEAADIKATASGLCVERDVVKKDNERLNNEVDQLNKQLEQLTYKYGELTAELQRVKLDKAELDGYAKQVSIERDTYKREAADARERADKATKEASNAISEATRLAEARKARGGDDL